MQGVDEFLLASLGAPRRSPRGKKKGGNSRRFSGPSGVRTSTRTAVSVEEGVSTSLLPKRNRREKVRTGARERGELLARLQAAVSGERSKGKKGKKT